MGDGGLTSNFGRRFIFGESPKVAVSVGVAAANAALVEFLDRIEGVIASNPSALTKHTEHVVVVITAGCPVFDLSLHRYVGSCLIVKSTFAI